MTMPGAPQRPNRLTGYKSREANGEASQTKAMFRKVFGRAMDVPHNKPMPLPDGPAAKSLGGGVNHFSN